MTRHRFVSDRARAIPTSPIKKFHRRVGNSCGRSKRRKASPDSPTPHNFDQKCHCSVRELNIDETGSRTIESHATHKIWAKVSMLLGAGAALTSIDVDQRTLLPMQCGLDSDIFIRQLSRFSPWPYIYIFEHVISTMGLKTHWIVQQRPREACESLATLVRLAALHLRTSAQTISCCGIICAAPGVHLRPTSIAESV